MRRDSNTRNLLFALASQIGPALLTAGLVLYLVRALGPSGFGVFSVALGITGLIGLPADFGVSQSAARFIAERRQRPEAAAGVLVDALRIKLSITSLVAVAMVALAGPIASLYGTPGLEWPLRILAISLLGQSITLLFSFSFIALGKLSYQFRLLFSESLIETVASVLFVALSGGATAAASGRAVGYLAAAVLGGLLAVRLFGIATLRRQKREVGQRRLARYAGAMLVVDGGWAVNAQLPVLLLGGIAGTTAAGYFSGPEKLVAALGYPGLAVANTLAPGVAKVSGEHADPGPVQSAMRWLLLLYAPVAVALAVWAEPIIDLLLGAGYEDSVNALRAISVAVFAKGFGPLMALSVNYLGGARRRIPVVAVSVLVNFGLLLLLIPPLGATGAAIGMSVSFVVYVAGHVRLCGKVLGIRLRPLIPSLARVMFASLLLGGLLALVGTRELSALQWLLGAVAGTVVYLGGLVADRELTVAELRDALVLVAGRLRASSNGR